MQKIEYAALKYYNNVISDECLCIGMLYNNLTTGRRDFRPISNYKRFQAFDDEVDTGFVKMYLLGIKQQVENNIFNFDKHFSIQEFAKIYVNEFRFSNVMTIDVSDDEDYVDNLTKIYLKFDINKSKRLSGAEEKKYIRRILSTTNAEFSSPKIKGVFDEHVNYDYIIKDVAIKLFSFKDKDASKLIPAAKQWSFSANELRDQYRSVFLYDENTVSPESKIVLRILEKNAEVYPLHEGLEHLVRTISNVEYTSGMHVT